MTSSDEIREMPAYKGMRARGFDDAEALRSIRRIIARERENAEWEQAQQAQSVLAARPAELSESLAAAVIRTAATGEAIGPIKINGDGVYFGADPIGKGDVEWWIEKDEVGYIAQGRFSNGLWS